MQSLALVCSVVLAVSVASDAYMFKRLAAQIMKRQQEEKSCCLPNSFTAIANTDGLHLIQKSDGLAEIPFKKTQTIVKSGTTQYKEVILDDDTPARSLLKFSKTYGYQYVYFPEYDCWTESRFDVEEGEDETEGIFCMDDGPYAGKGTYNGEQVDVWQTDASHGSAESVKKLYATVNARGECIPVYEEKQLLVNGGKAQKSDTSTTFEIRTSTRDEARLLTVPTNICDF